MTSDKPFASPAAPLSLGSIPLPPPNPSIVALGLAAALCALAGPRAGSPDTLVMAAILASSLLSSIAGFAFSAICGAMIFHLTASTVEAVQVMITCSIANQASMTWSLRREIDWRGVLPFVAGGLAGIPIGVWILLHADRVSYTHGLGAFLLVYGTYMLLRRPLTLRVQHPAMDAFSGFLGGIAGGAVGTPGAPIAIWCGFKGWDKFRQRAVFQPAILVLQVAALALIGVARQQGGLGAAFDPAYLLCVPAGLLGTTLGMRCFRTMSNRQFAIAVNALMVVSGIGYVL